MIVQPDFLDHWKTRMLADSLADPCAPLYVIRLWSYCQNRKTHGFPKGNPSILKAICHYPGDAKKFEEAMISCGFIDVVDEKWVAHEWESVNAYLIKAWQNGAMGGRPRKEPGENPRDTDRIPTGNPNETYKRREDKRREDKNTLPLYPPPGDADGSARGPRMRKTWTKAQLKAEAFGDWPRFLAWWAEYPRKDGKREAFHSWIRQGLEFRDSGPLMEKLRAKKSAPDWAKDGGKFVPMAATYLNQQRFDDEVDPPGPGPQALPNFDRWWAMYPRHEGEDAARAEWTRLGLENGQGRHGLPALLVTLMAQKHAWDDPKFIPLPANYLRDGRWKDEPLNGAGAARQSQNPYHTEMDVD